MKTFSLDEANALLPVLDSLLRSAIESKGKLQQLQEQAQQVAQKVFLAGGSLLKLSDLLAQKSESERITRSLHDAVAEIEATGVQVKDLDIGLLDFPCEVDGEIILLCWKMGEPAITHWHSTEEGFKGRKPIDARIANAKPKPPN